MAPVRHVSNDIELESAISNLGGDRCSIVYFYLPWCGSCQKMNPFVDSIAEKNPNAVFLKVDAERSQTSSKKHRITKVPIFVLYNNRIKVDRVEGASPMELESKIKRIQADLEYKRSAPMSQVMNVNALSAPQGQSPGHGQGQGVGYGTTQAHGPIQGQASVPSAPQRMTDISNYFDRKNCRVINDLVPSSLQEFLEGNKLVSGKGVGKLLLMYSFTEKMVINSFKLRAPVHSGPRVLRFFTTLQKGVDINVVSQMNAVQEVLLSEDDLNGVHVIDLRQGGFVGVTALQIYIPENQTASRRIEIDHLILIGAPMSLTPFASPGGRTDLEPFARMTGGVGAGVGGGVGLSAAETHHHGANTNNRRY